jgi:LPXTG-site transpeptidase (sortase) family protein
MLPPLITDKAVLAERLQATTKPRHLPSRPTIPSRLQPILVAVGIFALTLLAFKAPVIYEQLHYNAKASSNLTVPITPASAPVTAAPTISIPKINVNAPVVYLSSTDETAVLQGLENGVVHYGNTPNPGQGGNAVFFGHSSNDWWEPGNYKFVFVLLDKLIVGDTFSVNYQSKRYVYQVTGTQVVDPTDVAVLDQTNSPTATLITCSPPGTSWKRLVVSAKQISPSPTATPDKTSSTAGTASTTSLPGNAPGLLDQVDQAVSGAWHAVFGGGSKPKAAGKPASGTPSQLPAAD